MSRVARNPVAPAAARRPAWQQPWLLASLALAVLAVIFFVFQWLDRSSAATAERTLLFADIEREARKHPVDGDELSRLAVRVQKLPDANAAADAILAMARIESARGRVDRAAELLAPLANRPGATPGEQRLAAAVWLRQHELGAPDRSRAVALLQQALAFAERAYSDGQDSEDLLRAWLAALRLGDTERADQLAGQLIEGHGSTRGARLAQLVRNATLTMPRQDLEQLREQFELPPAELDVLLVTLLLQAGDVAAAIKLLEPLLLRAPGVIEVRRTAALAFHVCVLGAPEGSARQPWVQRRDAQLDWLALHASPEDTGRAGWAAMRNQK